MCSTCGCAEGERHIEGDENQPGDGLHGHQHGEHKHTRHGHDHDEHQHSHDGRDHGDRYHCHDGHDHGDHYHSHDGPAYGGHQHTHYDPEREVRPSAALAPRHVVFPAAPAQVIHHHHYHGEVHNHYYQLAPGQTLPLTAAGEPGPVPAAGPAGFTPLADARGDLDYGRGEAGTHAPGLSQRRMVEIEIDVLDKNNRLAHHNRHYFQQRAILALNLVSSPGSGKTSLLTETLLRLKDRIPCAVIEGDQQTTNDAERIRATGAPAIQVNTGKGCHLDAQMVHDAALRLDPAENSLLFIENVGNLVCPAGFDLGERCKVVVLSVTEGEDKPLKYPHMFAAAGLMILNKIDLLPWVRFDVDTCIANARRVNPSIAVLMVSATGGEGMDAWLSWLEEQRRL
ncbi:hydrogenase nickel incorporation protein HypB [Sodalis sp. RH15]|uniref:hydrogenase nickel incorporation protein HypB n=1 Tax=Sodalis sp. RH15 TaxID=3394330 RepID=UPI0039B6245E